VQSSIPGKEGEGGKEGERKGKGRKEGRKEGRKDGRKELCCVILICGSSV
jgi:hypothetical protein